MNEARIDCDKLRERIAEALGWSIDDTKRFSFQMLREIVRHHSKLAHEIDLAIRGGEYLLKKRVPNKSTRLDY
jgi:hypothetical protein